MSKNEFEKLIERYHQDSCTAEEKAWIENWLVRHEIHTESQWDQFTASEREQYVHDLFSKISSQINVDLEEDQPKTIHINRRKTIYALVASCAAILIGFFYFFNYQSGINSTDAVVEMVDVTVPQGKRKKLTLSDGSIVYLQGGSTLSYPLTFTKELREVHLAGEAFFEVMKSDGASFVVHTEYLSAKVLGTKFHVSAISEIPNTKIYLLEGKLSLKTKQQDSSTDLSELILNTNESATLLHDQQTMSKYKSSLQHSLDNFTSGVMNFEDERLSEILIKVANNYGIKIDNRTKDKDLLVSGLFKLEDPIREVIESICISTGTKSKWLNTKEVIIQ